MRVLFLGDDDNFIVDYLRVSNDVFCTKDKIDAESASQFDFLISYGYRHILKSDILSLFPDKAVNLHISYLPYNRGADPNLWSFLEGTPKGVTIHYMDEGIDTGDIIVQELVEMYPEDSLRTSYERLQIRIQRLFIKHWHYISNGTCLRIQQGEGTIHYIKDKIYFPLDINVWKLKLE